MGGVAALATNPDDRGGRRERQARVGRLVARRENAAAPPPPLPLRCRWSCVGGCGGYVRARNLLREIPRAADGDGFMLLSKDGGDRRISCGDFVSVPALRLRLRPWASSLTLEPPDFFLSFFGHYNNRFQIMDSDSCLSSDFLFLKKKRLCAEETK